MIKRFPFGPLEPDKPLSQSRAYNVFPAANGYRPVKSPATFAATLAGLTAFMRTLLDDGDAATACLTLGAVRVAGLSLGNPGYVRFQVGASSYFQVAWGNQVVSGNGATSIGYPAAFPNASWPTISGVGEFSTSAQDNNPAVQSATASGFTVYNASNACTAWWIAVGY